ncbi:MAG: DUF5723 family protein [Tannerellaceae bacterium]|nr:DUF5723 family protein [Tannerellaceae bacterium]
MRNSHSRLALNPAFIPRQGYISVADIAVGTNTSIYLDNLVFDKNNEKVTFMHPLVGSSEFLSGIPNQSNLSAKLNYQPASFGFFTKKGSFWSFGIGVRALMDINIPKPLFELLKVGFTADDRTLTYPVRDLRLSANGYTEISAGYARTFLNNRLSAGAKVKFLSGIAAVDLNIETLDVSVQKDQWTARSKATLKGSGIKAGYNEDGLFESVEVTGLGSNGLGLGLDLGAVYTITEKAKVSLAFTDLGFISWPGSNSIHLKAPETLITVTPGEYSTGEGNFNFKENLNTAIDDIREAINFKESGAAQGNTTLLRTTVNVGLEYEVLPGNLSAGLLSSTYFGNTTFTELTLSANYNPTKIKWLSAAISYSFINTNYRTFGMALHLAPKRGVHFFIASDYLLPKVSSDFLPVNSSTANIQFGLSIPIGKVRETNSLPKSE